MFEQNVEDTSAGSGDVSRVVDGGSTDVLSSRVLKSTACLLAGMVIGGGTETYGDVGPEIPAAHAGALDPSLQMAVKNEIASEKPSPFSFSFPDPSEYVQLIQKKAEAAMEGLKKLAADAEVMNRVSQDFPVNEIELKKLAPGMVTFTATYGEEQKGTFIAAGDEIFLVTEAATEKDQRTLKKINGQLKRIDAERNKLYAALNEKGYEIDADTLRYSDSLCGIDTAHMPAEVSKLFEQAGKLEKLSVTLGEKKEQLQIKINTSTLTPFGRETAERVELIKTPYSTSAKYALGYKNADNEPVRVRHYTSEKGLVSDIVIADLIKRIPENSSEVYSEVLKCKPFINPLLHKVARGEVAYTAKDQASAQLVAGYILARSSDPVAFEPLLKIVRGELAVKDGYIRKDEVPGAILGMNSSNSPEFLRLLTDRSTEVQILGARYFEKNPSNIATAELEDMLGSEHKYVRRHAAIALGNTLNEKALTPLIRLMEENVPTLSEKAARALVCYSDEKAFRAIQDALKDPVIAKHAAVGAARSNNEKIVDSLVEYACTNGASESVLKGLNRWTTRDNKDALSGLILAAYNPGTSKDFQQSAEGCLIALTPTKERWLIESAREYQKKIPFSAPQWHKEACGIFVAARELGLEFVHRIPPQHRMEVIQNRHNLKPDGRPLAVLVMARGDHNGAFYLSDEIFEGLMTHNHRVVYYEAENDRDLVKCLKAGTGLGTANEQKAQVLVFGGHGSQSSLHLERYERPQKKNQGMLEPDDEEMLKRSGVSATLADGGQIVLDSCSNGKGCETADGKEGRPLNMANFMRRIFPQAKEKGIWSAQESYGPIEFKFNDDNELIEVEYPVPSYQANLGRRFGDTQLA